MPRRATTRGALAAGAPSAGAPAAGACGRRRRPEVQWSAVVARWARSLAAISSGSVGFERYASAPSAQLRTRSRSSVLQVSMSTWVCGARPRSRACLEHVVAVDVGHHHVEDHRGGRVRGQLVDGLLTAGGEADVELAAERVAEHGADVRIVIDDQHVGRVHAERIDANAPAGE